MKNKEKTQNPDFQIGDVVILKSDAMESDSKKVIEDVLMETAYLVYTDKKGEIQRKSVNFSALMLWQEPQEPTAEQKPKTPEEILDEKIRGIF